MKRKIRQYRKSIFVISLLVISTGIYSATQSSLLDVDKIEVVITGGDRLSQEDVLKKSGIELSQSMLSVDSETAEKSIIGNPWVEEVEVSRNWPSAVSIWVSLRKPFANAVTSTGLVALIDSSGIVIEGTSKRTELLPTILVEEIGVPGSEITNIEMLISVAREVTPDINEWIEIITPVATGVRLKLNGSVFVDLGSPNDFSVPLKDLKAVLGQVELTCIQSIDVSIRENPVVVRDSARCN